MALQRRVMRRQHGCGDDKRVVERKWRDQAAAAKIGELPLGFGNHARVLSDPLFWRSTLNSALYVGGSVGGAFLVPDASASPAFACSTMLPAPKPPPSWTSSPT